MRESALQLRRRCLFLFHKGVLWTALQRPDVLTKVDAILQRGQMMDKMELNGDDPAVVAGAAAAAALLVASLQRWLERHQFPDWEECMEWLLFMVDEAEREQTKCSVAMADFSMEMLQELITLFAEEARACDTEEASFTENYWRDVLKRMQLQVGGGANGGDDCESEAETRCTRPCVSWSIAARLPPDVEQIFLPP